RAKRRVEVLAALVRRYQAFSFTHDKNPVWLRGWQRLRYTASRLNRYSGRGKAREGAQSSDNHRDSSFKPSRMSLALSASSPPFFRAAAIALVACSRE